MLTLTWPLMLLALPLPLLVYFFAPRRKQEQGEVFAPSLMTVSYTHLTLPTIYSV